MFGFALFDFEMHNITTDGRHVQEIIQVTLANIDDIA